MNPLIASIINNPSTHRVNRADKMNRSLDAHISNIEARRDANSRSVLTERDEALERGYGTGKRQGD